MIGLALLAVFAICAALMYARLFPALLAVPLMALAMAALAGAKPGALASVLVEGSVRLAPVIAVVIFGATLSRVTLSTGIAETLVDYAAEFGGDRPIVLALCLSAVVAFLFTGLYGLGAIIMVGSIVLPVMMTVGVPRRTAATIFMLAYALGFIFNISQWAFYTKTFGVERGQMQPFAYVLATLDAVALIAFAIARFRTTRGHATWALTFEEERPRRRAAAWALLAPILPIALYFIWGVHPIVAFAAAALYGVLTTRPRDAVETLVAAAIRGVEDVAPAILLFMGIGMLLVATGMPVVKAALEPLVAAVAPRSWVGYVVLFGLLSPLALYRGPLNPFGVGIAVYTVLAGLGILPPVVLVAALMAVVQVQNACDPTNTQNVWVANFTGVRVDEITRITLPYQVAVATCATLAVVLFGPSLFGISAFGPGTAAAAATPSAAALFVGSSSARTLAVAPAGNALSVPVARAVYRQIAGGWRGYRALWLDAAPAPSVCTSKPYAATLLVDAEAVAIAGDAARTIEAGLSLSDCAGWPVDEWHDVIQTVPSTDLRASLEAEGLALLFRLRTWMLDRPAAAETLLETGLAYDPARDAPTYLYSLFKSEDGAMRAYVRPGGPAYAAGLRTNDVVEKVDGRFWWEDGTFQTQARAYDGKSHTFVVERDKAELTIALGAPFVPSAHPLPQ
jgi:hypothetical protein